MCWLWSKKKELTVSEILHSCTSVGGVNDNVNDIDCIGMMKGNKLHGYGVRIFHNIEGLEFGIFENDKLKVRMWDVIHDIQTQIGTESKMVASSTALGKGAYLGEYVSIASHEEDPSLRKDRYGIMFFPEGMYVGKFPPGYFMQHCEGDFYDLNGQKHSGIYDFNIADTHRWGDDKLGGYFPSF